MYFAYTFLICTYTYLLKFTLKSIFQKITYSTYVPTHIKVHIYIIYLKINYNLIFNNFHIKTFIEIIKYWIKKKKPFTI